MWLHCERPSGVLSRDGGRRVQRDLLGQVAQQAQPPLGSSQAPKFFDSAISFLEFDFFGGFPWVCRKQIFGEEFEVSSPQWGIYLKAEPMDEELSKAIEDGTVGPKADPKDGVGGMKRWELMGWDMSQKQQKHVSPGALVSMGKASGWIYFMVWFS